MKIFSIAFITIAGLWLIVILVVNTTCSSPDYFELKGGKLELVKINGIKTYYKKDREIDSTVCYSITEAKVVSDSLSYGILVTNDIRYSFHSGANQSLAVHAPGILGSNQKILSVHLFTVDEAHHSTRDISAFTQGIDTVSDYLRTGESYEYPHYVNSSAGVESMIDSFNTGWSTHPPFGIEELFYKLDSAVIKTLPARFKMTLVVQFVDGSSYSAESREYRK